MKLKITILLALTVLLNCSCSDFLDLEPKNCLLYTSDAADD